MAITKDGAPRTFAKDDRAGTSFGTVVRTVNRPSKSPIAPIGLLPTLHARGEHCAVLAWPVRARSGGAMDWRAGARGTAFCARHSFAQHSRPRTSPSRDAGHRALERRPGIPSQ